MEQNTLSSQDVTEEYVDLSRRIQNKEAEVQSYRELFKEAKKIPDILSVSEKLYQAQENLERLQGRKKYLESLSDLATVNVYLGERGVYVPAESLDFGTSVGRTFSGSVNALVQFGRGAALVAVALVPWLPIMLVIGVPVFLAWRHHRRQAIPTVTEVPPSAAPPTQG